ncbi:helix-turn-helix domain-containing protein [Flavihumibacter sp. UBA7668]|uniref:helix-turn-helix domain-containing protein n=1 Tax=Flavihumibacter sp. UBA7668 TaxID=1946542 RepID=UPI0025C26400|nr:AraC family transcriptional regulator [Flavihumibacter sp. UBA7668]
MILYIRNMACESCLLLVQEELEKLGIKPVRVDLGEVELPGLISDEKKQNFAQAIEKGGLELVDSEEEVLIDKIKGGIADFIMNKRKIKQNLSDYLADLLGMEYKQLASYFSGLTGNTIEQYGIALKIEKAKEMLTIENKSLKEVAELLDYKQVAHLSNQFKKITGISPSQFKKEGIARRKTMQELGKVG